MRFLREIIYTYPSSWFPWCWSFLRDVGVEFVAKPSGMLSGSLLLFCYFVPFSGGKCGQAAITCRFLLYRQLSQALYWNAVFLQDMQRLLRSCFCSVLCLLQSP